MLLEALRQNPGVSTPVVQDAWRGCGGSRLKVWNTNQGEQPLPARSA
jgi:hypothetical protein